MNKALAFVGCIILFGCATAGTKIDESRISQIKEGVTTQAEVESILGKPMMKTIGTGGATIMTYHYVKVKNRAVNFIPVAGLLAGGMDMNQQMLTIEIGPDDKVIRYVYNNNASEMNSGLLNTR